MEHFRPKSIFPELAMDWNNFLWVCGVCNQSKGDRFPPKTEPGASVIDPGSENPWNFFFIDDFGNLNARWDTLLDAPNPRAENTIRLLALDRDPLQQARHRRLEDLKIAIQEPVAKWTDQLVSAVS
ncbi:MAG: hypothetical protein HQL99_15960 [Magnetococcales bacterium]|nr:hypothetical protein [Magnetococcales bacterium]